MTLTVDGVAYFLDIDGTLVDLAHTPDAVILHPELPLVVESLYHSSGGAIALITGRSIRRHIAERLTDSPEPAIVPFSRHFSILTDGPFHTDSSPWREFRHSPGTLVAPTSHLRAQHSSPVVRRDGPAGSKDGHQQHRTAQGSRMAEIRNKPSPPCALGPGCRQLGAG